MVFLSPLIANARVLKSGTEPPVAFGPVPSERQLRWHELEFYGFIHFTINTFTDKEWGYGDEQPSVFNPTDFDADQIVRTAKEAGMNGLILTCKHHDGFCLWPSKYTRHSVRNSSWKAGRGDVVKEISEACRRHGIEFGVYLSPWDRNHKDYGSSEYLAYFRNQLHELLTSYGPIFEIFFDGANGGDGFYGGASEKRLIDRDIYYDWTNTWQLVRKLQPDACIFSDAGPDVRWAGNERGVAGEPNWLTLNRQDFAPGRADTDRLNHGDRDGTHWVPPECATTRELVIELGKEKTFNVVRLREYLPLGQRIEGFALDRWKDGDWQEFANGTSIGSCRLLRVRPVTTTKVRLRITKAPVCPALAELALFAEPQR